jgi:adenosylcobinamide kinase / adenosylcobinamide-phosphate guanylyltransferase
MAELTIARRELILGGQKSGKSRRAESLAKAWLDQAPRHRAMLLATGQAWDGEMRERIARHQNDRARRVPGMQTVETPLHLAKAIASLSHPDNLLVVDCMTLWLTNWMMPAGAAPSEPAPVSELLKALEAAPGPVVLVGNEIGLGVIPLGQEVRAFVDALGRLNQSLAAGCSRVTLMVAGLPLTLKEAS